MDGEHLPIFWRRRGWGLSPQETNPFSPPHLLPCQLGTLADVCYLPPRGVVLAWIFGFLLFDLELAPGEADRQQIRELSVCSASSGQEGTASSTSRTGSGILRAKEERHCPPPHALDPRGIPLSLPCAFISPSLKMDGAKSYCKRALEIYLRNRFGDLSQKQQPAGTGG